MKLATRGLYNSITLKLWILKIFLIWKPTNKVYVEVIPKCISPKQINQISEKEK